MFRILLLVLELLSGKSHRPGVCNSIQAGSEALEPGMKLDEFVLVERLHSWPLDKQSQSAGTDASWIAEHSSALELDRTTPSQGNPLDRKTTPLGSATPRGPSSGGKGRLAPINVGQVPAHGIGNGGGNATVTSEPSTDGKLRLAPIKPEVPGYNAQENPFYRYRTGKAFVVVWKATVQGSQGEEHRALKLFWLENEGYQTWNTENGEVRNAMRREDRACKKVMELIDLANEEKHSAQRYIIKCLESRLMAEPAQVGYIVEEYGGKNLYSLGNENRLPKQVLEDAREISVQLLSVLDLLASREPKLSHHHLTPANIVWQRTEQDRILIKVANWHDFMDSGSKDHEVCVGSETYLPPEYWDEQKHACDFSVWDPENPNLRANLIETYDIYAAGLVYAVALLLAKTPPMTEAEVSSARSRIEGIWTKSEVKNVSRLFGPPPSSDTQQQDGLEEDISQQTGEEAAESNWAEVVLEVQEPKMLDKMRARTNEALVRAGKKATGRKYAVGDSNLAGALQMGPEHKLAVAEPHAQRLSSLVEAFKRFAEEHQLEFPTADAQLLSRLTSANPKDRPTALQAAVEVNGFEEPGIASWNIGSFGCENFQDRVQQFVRLLTSESGISELASCDYESETKTHRKYNIERTDFTRGEVKLTIFNKGGHKWPMLEDGKIVTREWEQKGEGIPFSLQKCILDTALATYESTPEFLQRDLLFIPNLREKWCCKLSYMYEGKNMDVTFWMKSQSLNEEDLVLEFQEGGDFERRTNHIRVRTPFKKTSCSSREDRA